MIPLEAYDYLLDKVQYVNGVPLWIVKAKGANIGDVAGSVDKRSKYRRFSIRLHGRKMHVASSRLSFYMSNGFIPDKVDHVDRDRGNDDPLNLREVTNSQNAMNSTKRRGCQSKYKGVCRVGNRFRSVIWYDNHSVHIGTYDSEVDAAIAYNKQAIKYFGSFACINEFDEVIVSTLINNKEDK